MPTKGSKRAREETEAADVPTPAPTIVVPAAQPDVLGAIAGNRAYVTLPAPDFTADALMPNMSMGKVSLSDYKGKYLVLFFYPLDFTFVCPTEIIAFSERAAEFKAAGCEVVGASVDSLNSHWAWVSQPRKEGGLGEMKIPLIADLTKALSKDYGCLLSGGHSLRGLFIIDDKGIIRHISMNDPPVGRNVDEVLRLVQAYQYTDIHGEVCPMGWKPGSKTIKPTPTGSKEFFAEEHKD